MKQASKVVHIMFLFCYSAVSIRKACHEDYKPLYLCWLYALNTVIMDSTKLCIQSRSSTIEITFNSSILMFWKKLLMLTLSTFFCGVLFELKTLVVNTAVLPLVAHTIRTWKKNNVKKYYLNSSIKL